MSKLKIISIAVVGALFAGVTSAQQPTIKQQVMDIAASSSCAQTNWRDRGKTPAAYMRGTAVSYARALCSPTNPYVQIASKGIGSNPVDYKPLDSLAWYNSLFRSIGITNSNDGRVALRSTYLLMIGLAQRESSGRYCVGRDMSAEFVAHDSAEAGLYQTSWGVRRRNPALLEGMTQSYANDRSRCLLSEFSSGVSCRASDAVNWGQGSGVAWQELTKSCPAFATEYAAVILRQGGGERGEFGPIRRRAAELAPSCNTMLQRVETLVLADPSNCDEFK